MKLSGFLYVCLSLFLLSACATEKYLPPESPVRYVSKPVECVPYAREVSGIEIYGDAHTWWNRAKPRYECGQEPRIGAVLVLSKTSKMTSGHVAVVKSIVNSRKITVTHSNWGNNRTRRKVIYYAMPVEDISANNDWTRVRFWNYEEGVYGFPYAAKGFIYK